MSSTSLTLQPKPGFCIKTTTLQPGSLVPENPNKNESILAVNSSPSVYVPLGLKVFVNIAWDENVPPPPRANEDAIQAAMQGNIENDLDPDAWYVPLVVSEGRQDLDKAGKPSLVFDAIFNISLKARNSKDPTFKLFLIELALQRIEAQTSLLLSREIATPKLASKGTLAARTVTVPPGLSPQSKAASPKPLIEEISSDAAPSRETSKGLGSPSSATKTSGLRTPSWTHMMSGSSLQLIIQVPELTHSHITNATLDLEPHRLMLSIPPLYALDLSISQLHPMLSSSAAIRDFDVDGAKAEWRVAEGVLVITA